MIRRLVARLACGALFTGGVGACDSEASDGPSIDAGASESGAGTAGGAPGTGGVGTGGQSGGAGDGGSATGGGEGGRAGCLVRVGCEEYVQNYGEPGVCLATRSEAVFEALFSCICNACGVMQSDVCYQACRTPETEIDSACSSCFSSAAGDACMQELMLCSSD